MKYVSILILELMLALSAFATPNSSLIKLEKYLLSHDGKVQVENVGNWQGQWNVEPSTGKVMISSDGKVIDQIPVKWKFENNELVMLIGETAIHNFSIPVENREITPKISLLNNAINVIPSVGTSNGFSFSLNAEYSLSKNLVLKVTIGNTESEIVGFVRGEPITNGDNITFVFASPNRMLLQHALRFTGFWTVDNPNRAELSFILVNGPNTSRLFSSEEISTDDTGALQIKGTRVGRKVAEVPYTIRFQTLPIYEFSNDGKLVNNQISFMIVSKAESSAKSRYLSWNCSLEKLADNQFFCGNFIKNEKPVIQLKIH